MVNNINGGLGTQRSVGSENDITIKRSLGTKVGSDAVKGHTVQMSVGMDN